MLESESYHGSLGYVVLFGELFSDSNDSGVLN